MVDVARRLGVSKATVSLAVNGKPGVNEETRKKVLACIEELEKGVPAGEMQPGAGREDETERRNISPSEPWMTGPAKDAAVNPPEQMIKVVIINHRKQVVCDPEMDLWSDVLAAFDAEARRVGYIYGFTYLNESPEEKEAVLSECNAELVAGVILYGTEIEKEDEELIRRIKKPVVVYDCEIPGGNYSSVCIDNTEAVKMALEVLEEEGAGEIKYLSTGKEIYNFDKRREAFLTEMLRREKFVTKSDVIQLGNTIPEITENMQNWLNQNPLPDGFLFENYQVTIGAVTAMRKYGLRIPKDIKVIGIDEIPEYIFPDIPIPQLQIPHTERAVMAVDLLDKEIRRSWTARIRMFAEPHRKERV